MAKLNLEEMKRKAIRGTPDVAMKLEGGKATPKALLKPGKRLGQAFNKKLRARLVAQEFMRNGMNLKAAYETVSGLPCKGDPEKKLGDALTDFIAEIAKSIDRPDLQKDQAIALLWAGLTVSPLDFLDNDGNHLTIEQLKKLPREIQSIIEEVKVDTHHEIVRDENGKKVKDDDGNYLFVPIQRARVRLMQKGNLMMQLAQIMKWVGPTVQVNNTTVNIGAVMVQADQNRERAIAAMKDVHSATTMIEGTASRVEGNDP